jgi:hypothetical protein
LISLASFLNPDGGEASAIGRLYYNQGNDERYLEMRQAEDYVAFELVDDHPSPLGLQGRGLYGHRKSETRRINVEDARQILELAQGKKLHLDDAWGEGVLLVARYQEGAGFACALGSYGKVVRVCIDEPDWASLTTILGAMIVAYDEAQKRKVYETKPRRVWDEIVQGLESWEADAITKQYQDEGYAPDDGVTVEFPDQYERDRALVIEVEDTMPGWRRIHEQLRADGKEALAREVSNKLAGYEYGSNSTTFVVLDFDWEIGQQVKEAQQAAAFAEVYS